MAADHQRVETSRTKLQNKVCKCHSSFYLYCSVANEAIQVTFVNNLTVSKRCQVKKFKSYNFNDIVDIFFDINIRYFSNIATARHMFFQMK